MINSWRLKKITKSVSPIGYSRDLMKCTFLQIEYKEFIKWTELNHGNYDMLDIFRQGKRVEYLGYINFSLPVCVDIQSNPDLRTPSSYVTPYYCRQFAYPWGKKALTLSLNSTRLIRTLFMPHLPPPPPPPTLSNCVRINGVWLSLVQDTQSQCLENICSEEDLRSRIFGTFVVKFLACLPLLGFSNI